MRFSYSSDVVGEAGALLFWVSFVAVGAVEKDGNENEGKLGVSETVVVGAAANVGPSGLVATLLWPLVEDMVDVIVDCMEN